MRTRRRRAGGFLGMVVLVVALEVVVGSRRDFADPVALEWRNVARATRDRAKHAEVICLGDSMIKFGISAPVLEARLGRRVANLAMSAAPASASYFALSRAIEAGARPRLVLVDYAPFLLLPGYRLNQQYLPEAADLGKSLDLAWTADDPELGGTMVLGQFIPTVRNRTYLRTRARRTWTSLPPGRRATGTEGGNGRRLDLWLPGGNQEVYDWFYPRAWECGAEHRTYVERLMALAADHGATVAWIMTPIGDEIADEWRALDLDARYTRFAGTIQSRFPDLVVIDARKLDLDGTFRTDPLHLNPRGAEVFTAELADLLGDVPRESRWIEMSSARRLTARTID